MPCRAAGEEEGGWRHPGGRGLTDGITDRIAGRGDERSLPGRLEAPGTGLDHSVIAFGEAAGHRDAEGAARPGPQRQKTSGRGNIARAEAATMLTTTAVVANPVPEKTTEFNK